MAQRLRTMTASSRCSEINLLQPHGGSQLPVMTAGALSWPAGIYHMQAEHHTHSK